MLSLLCRLGKLPLPRLVCRRTGAFMQAFGQGLPLLEQLHVDSAWVRAIGDWHICLWFKVSGSTCWVLPRSGTRPGDPLADLVFNLAFAVFQHLLDKTSSV